MQGRRAPFDREATRIQKGARRSEGGIDRLAGGKVAVEMPGATAALSGIGNCMAITAGMPRRMRLCATPPKGSRLDDVAPMQLLRKTSRSEVK